MERRTHIRFEPGHTDVAVIALGGTNGDGEPALKGDLVGLLLNQSYQGCNLVTVNRNRDPGLLSQGTECVVKAGALHPMRAIVRWREAVGPDLLEVGIEFLE